MSYEGSGRKPECGSGGLRFSSESNLFGILYQAVYRVLVSVFSEQKQAFKSNSKNATGDLIAHGHYI